MEVFDKHLTDCITTRDKENDITDVPDWNSLSIDEHDTNFDGEFKKVISNDGVTEADDNNAVKTPEMFDSYINMEVGLPMGNAGERYHATFKRCAIDDDGKPLGVGTYKPITDTRLYEVGYLDGTVENLSANVIAEDLLSQVDHEGHRHILIDEIIEHRKIQKPLNRRILFTKLEMETSSGKIPPKGGSYVSNGKVDHPIG